MDWNGTEIVMDAGSGSGNLTKILADKVPQRHVYAVDADPNMVQQAKSNLSDYKRQRRCTIAADPEL
jgi:FkbM family methyltransferase